MKKIAVNNPELIPVLRRFVPELEPVCATGPGLDALVGQVELFLLDDEAAIRLLGGRSEQDWPSVVVTVRDGDPLPSSYRQGLAQDLLVLPARALDFPRILSAHATTKALQALEASSHSMGGLVKSLQEDISLAQKIQRRLIREKFAPLGPLSVKSKYWCGLQAGGDYFDFFELPGGTHAGLLLCDSSSYSLSTALIGELVHFSVQAGAMNPGRPDEVLRALHGKLREGMKEKDRLSILFGVLDRRSYHWTMSAAGGVHVALQRKNGRLEWGTQAEPLSLSQPEPGSCFELALEPGERMMVCSDGWGSALGIPTVGFMEAQLGLAHDSQELMNEMAFQLRRKLEREEGAEAGEFPMPPEDCSVLLFELAANTLRLAR